MVDYLAAWWVHDLTVRRFTGYDAYGKRQYATAQTIKGFVNDTRRMVRNADGVEVVSETTVYLPAGTATIPVDSEVTLPATFGGRVTTVLAVSVHDGGGQPTPDHVELALV